MTTADPGDTFPVMRRPHLRPLPMTLTDEQALIGLMAATPLGKLAEGYPGDDIPARPNYLDYESWAWHRVQAKSLVWKLPAAETAKRLGVAEAMGLDPDW